MIFSKGFKHFLLKGGIFLGVLFFIQLILANSKSEKFIMSNLPKFFIIVDLATAFMASLILLFIIYKERLFLMKGFSFNLKNSCIFGILSILVFVVYLAFSKFIAVNFLGDIFYVILRYLFLFFVLFFLVLSIFGKEFIKSLSKRGLALFFGFVVLVYLFIRFFQNSWYFFSSLVTRAVYFILNLNFNAVIDLSQSIPIVGIDIFRIGIAESCSGISSMFLFMFLYVFAVFYDWKILNKVKALILFIPGIVSVFCLNILRIYLIVLLGAYFSKDFAVGIFHTGIAGILFVVYFAVFWKLSYKWLKK
jgi:exosortase/archaeosortase family protein